MKDLDRTFVVSRQLLDEAAKETKKNQKTRCFQAISNNICAKLHTPENSRERFKIFLFQTFHWADVDSARASIL